MRFESYGHASPAACALSRRAARAAVVSVLRGANEGMSWSCGWCRAMRKMTVDSSGDRSRRRRSRSVSETCLGDAGVGAFPRDVQANAMPASACFCWLRRISIVRNRRFVRARYRDPRSFGCYARLSGIASRKRVTRAIAMEGCAASFGDAQGQMRRKLSRQVAVSVVPPGFSGAPCGFERRDRCFPPSDASTPWRSLISQSTPVSMRPPCWNVPSWYEEAEVRHGRIGVPCRSNTVLLLPTTTTTTARMVHCSMTFVPIWTG